MDFFQFPFRPGGSEQAKIIWITKLRWLAILLFLVCGAVGFLFGYPERAHVGAYIGAVALLTVFNVFTQIFYSGSQKPVRQVVICFQLAFDLLVLSFCLYLTGGIENPFVHLFLLNASLGALLIPGYLTLPFLLMVHGMLAALQLEYISDIEGAPNRIEVVLNILIAHFLVFGFWLVMRSLGSYFERQHSRQVQNRVLIEKQDRLRAIGSLAAGFSHEFASPLNAAKLRIERLMRNQPSEDSAEAMSAILACENVIHGMNASQMDTQILKRPVAVNQLLREVIQTWQEDRSDAKLEMHIEDLGRIEIPPVNFAQVILNLLDNAADANPGGLIQVSLMKKNQSCIFKIQDQGAGFTPEALEKLGEPFMTTKREGTGLGLYVSSLFAQSLGGELKVANEKNSGALVSIEWPFKEHAHG